MALVPFAKPTPADAQNSSKVSQSQFCTPKHNQGGLDRVTCRKAVFTKSDNGLEKKVITSEKFDLLRASLMKCREAGEAPLPSLPCDAVGIAVELGSHAEIMWVVKLAKLHLKQEMAGRSLVKADRSGGAVD